MYAPADRLDVHYSRSGEGAPLVLLHGGLLTNELNWSALLPRLTTTHDVLAVELQGHGRTPDSDRPLTLDALADDVVAVLDHAGVERADLLGFSLGGMVAAQTALRHPERVDRLVLASVPVRPEGYVDLGAHPERMPTADDFAAMQQAYRDVAPDPDHFEEFSAKAEVFVQAFRGWTDEELATITAPTLVLVGDIDFVTVEHAAAAARLIPDAGLAVLPRTTHMQATGAASFDVVERFLAR